MAYSETGELSGTVCMAATAQKAVAHGLLPAACGEKKVVPPENE